MIGTAVLVHGGWGNPSDWRWVAGELASRGVRTTAVDLPSCARPDASRSDDIAAVLEEVSSIESPAVVVGWSYGAAVVADVPDMPASVTHLTLTGWLPEIPTGSDVDEAGTGAATPTPDLSLIRFLDDGTCVLDHDMWMASESGRSLPDAIRAGLLPRRPIAIAAWAAPVVADAWRSTPTTFVIGRDDDLVPDAGRAIELGLFADLRLIDGDHFVLFRDPAYLAAVISEQLVHL